MRLESIIEASTFARAIGILIEQSPVLRDILERYGSPPLWRREPGFASLVYAIIEQQVSLASARAVYDRLVSVSNGLTERSFLDLDDDRLRSVGFSRQKIEYCRTLASAIVSGSLDLDSLADEDDERIREVLTSYRGIGPWTADVYLLHSLGRPDVWPTGDLALKIAAQEALELAKRPDESELEEIGRPFRPWRSVAARLFWHGYLSRRGVVDVT